MTYPVVQLRRFARRVNGGTPTPDDANWNGGIPWATPIDLGRHDGRSIETTARTLTELGIESGSSLVPSNSVLVSTRAPIGYVSINTVPMAFNQGCRALVPDERIEARFLSYAMQHLRPAMDALGTGTTFNELSSGAMGTLQVPAPDAITQGRIADFLDRETAQIDAMIGRQEELVELLGERRSAVIAHAVTKGLNTDAPLKDSGVEWLGEVPAHWQVVPLKRVLDRVDQGVSPQAWAELAEDGGWGVLKSGCMNGGTFRETEHKALDPDFDIDPTIVVEEGDFVVSRASGSPNLVGSAAIVHSLSYNLILSDKTFRLVFAERQEQGYYYWVMNSSAYREQVRLAISGADGLANNLPLSSLRRIVIPSPPSSEQVAIADHLSGVVGAIDTVVTKAKESIALITERRAALISAAVTGRLDIDTYGRQQRREKGVA